MLYQPVVTAACVVAGAWVLFPEPPVTLAGAVGAVVNVEAGIDAVAETPQSPATEGTASGPLPMARRLEPQSSLLAKWIFWLSQS